MSQYMIIKMKNLAKEDSTDEQSVEVDSAAVTLVVDLEMVKENSTEE